jgi:excisionase family DNA binding protein
MSGIDELLTTDQVAELLHMPRSTVEDYARRGVLPSIKLGRHRRFVLSDVADAIELLRLGSASRRSDAAESDRPSGRRHHSRRPEERHL